MKTGGDLFVLCVAAEDRVVEKRWQALFSSAAPSLEYRVGKVNFMRGVKLGTRDYLVACTPRMFVISFLRSLMAMISSVL